MRTAGVTKNWLVSRSMETPVSCGSGVRVESVLMSYQMQMRMHTFTPLQKIFPVTLVLSIFGHSIL